MQINIIKLNSSYVITFIFFVLSFWLVHFHEMWADELHSWTFARDVNSISTFFYSLKYGGHPSLWYLIVYPFSKIFSNNISIQYLHIIISTFNIYILNRYSPFSYYKKILITFSYFFFYEYSLITRNYSLTILLIFIICTLITIKSNSRLLISFFIFLLCHSHVFGIVFAISFLAYFNSEKYFKNNKFLKQDKIDLISLIIIVIGILSSFLTVIQPSDSPLASSFSNYILFDNYLILIKSFISGYLPIPKFKYEFWNSIIYYDKNFIILGSFIVFTMITFIFISVFSFINRPSALIFFFCSTFGLFCLFLYTKYLGAIRHSGFFFITFLATMWIKESSKNLNLINFYKGYFELCVKKIVNYFFLFICTAHFIATIFPVYLDYNYPFSGAIETANYIKKEKLDNYQIVSNPSFNTSAVIGHLDKKKSFYINENRYATYYTFDSSLNLAYQHKNFLQKIIELKNHHGSLLILLNYNIAENILNDLNLVKVFQSKKSIVRDEIFYLYTFR